LQAFKESDTIDFLPFTAGLAFVKVPLEACQLKGADFFTLLPQAKGVTDDLAIGGVAAAFNGALHHGCLVRRQGYGKGSHTCGFHSSALARLTRINKYCYE